MKQSYTSYQNIGVKSEKESVEVEFSGFEVSFCAQTSVVASFSLVNSTAASTSVDDAACDGESDATDVLNIMGSEEKGHDLSATVNDDKDNSTSNK